MVCEDGTLTQRGIVTCLFEGESQTLESEIHGPDPSSFLGSSWPPRMVMSCQPVRMMCGEIDSRLYVDGIGDSKGVG